MFRRNLNENKIHSIKSIVTENYNSNKNKCSTTTIMLRDCGYGVQCHFNNISAISWRSVLLVEETGVPGEKPPTCRKSLTNCIT